MPKHILFMLFLFWSTWLYTETTEFMEREAFGEEVKEFMHQAGRNTREMGRALCDRVSHLEAEHHDSAPAEACVEIYGGDRASK